MVKELARAVLAGLGLHAFRISTIPRGISLAIDLQRLFRQRPPSVILDVGANVGQYSKFFAARFPGATIWAIEPVTSTYRLLVENSKANSRIRAENLAFGDRSGIACMELLEDSCWCRVVPDDSLAVRDPSHYQRISMLRLDDFCDERRIAGIDILKSDCEGFDLKVLRGAGKYLKKAAIDAIYVEVNFRRDGKHGDFFEIESYLTQFGYIFYGLYEYSGWQYDVSKFGYANALFVSRRLAGQGQGSS